MDSTRASLALVVGRTRREAVKLFGGDLDDFQTTTYAELPDRLVAVDPGFLGISAGEGMVDAVRTVLAARDRFPGMQLVVELPLRQQASESLQAALEAAGARVEEVRHYRQRPCLVVTGDEGGSEGSSTTLATVLAAASRPRDPAFGRQLTSATRWELDAARARVSLLEEELDTATREVFAAQAEIRSLKGRPSQRKLTAKAQQALTHEYRAEEQADDGLRTLARRLERLASALLGGGRRGRFLALAGAALACLVLLPIVSGLLAGRVGALVGFAVAFVALLSVLGFAALGAALVQVGRQVANLGGQQQVLATNLRLVIEQAEALRAGTDVVDLAVRQQRRALKALPTVEHVDKVETAMGETLQATLNLFQLVDVAAAVPPMSNWAAAPDLVLWTVDTFLKDRPGLVVECGSGVSTLFLALAAKQHGVASRIVALEHDRSFARRTRELLAHHGVTDYAEVRHAPLVRTSLPDHHTPWYSEDALVDLDGIGLLLVDGPPGNTGPRTRYPAVPLLRDRLAGSCTILADDMVRDEDREVVEAWWPLLPDFRYEVPPLRKGAAVFRRDETPGAPR